MKSLRSSVGDRLSWLDILAQLLTISEPVKETQNHKQWEPEKYSSIYLCACNVFIIAGWTRVRHVKDWGGVFLILYFIWNVQFLAYKERERKKQIHFIGLMIITC